ncbi:unnamed protein product [Arabidopsis arenosa]|uniref:DUF4216 domain-containing protein n=1 Tax=Arabidopsis arenosa TaxID=38785 RepID=A0A8S1ZRY7_ARAAE|nr:unnamed protein product [Arabidopsis arenosa]
MPTSNYGISSQSGNLVYYEVLHEILEVHYPGMIELRFVAFYWDWYDPTRGVRQDEFGVTSVHSIRKLPKYDPFILASQEDQVCYIRYPRVKNKDDHWITVTAIHPRGRVDGVCDHDPLQQNGVGYLGPVELSLEVDLVVDFDSDGDDEVHEDSEDEVEEFDDSDSIPSDYSLDSDSE